MINDITIGPRNTPIRWGMDEWDKEAAVKRLVQEVTDSKDDYYTVFMNLLMHGNGETYGLLKEDYNYLVMSGEHRAFIHLMLEKNGLHGYNIRVLTECYVALWYILAEYNYEHIQEDIDFHYLIMGVCVYAKPLIDMLSSVCYITEREMEQADHELQELYDSGRADAMPRYKPTSYPKKLANIQYAIENYVKQDIDLFKRSK